MLKVTPLIPGAITWKMVPVVLMMFLLREDLVKASKMLPAIVQLAMMALMLYVLLRAMLILSVMMEEGRWEPGGACCSAGNGSPTSCL